MQTELTAEFSNMEVTGDLDGSPREVMGQETGLDEGIMRAED